MGPVQFSNRALITWQMSDDPSGEEKKKKKKRDGRRKGKKDGQSDMGSISIETLLRGKSMERPGSKNKKKKKKKRKRKKIMPADLILDQDHQSSFGKIKQKNLVNWQYYIVRGRLYNQKNRKNREFPNYYSREAKSALLKNSPYLNLRWARKGCYEKQYTIFHVDTYKACFL